MYVLIWLWYECRLYIIWTAQTFDLEMIGRLNLGKIMKIYVKFASNTVKLEMFARTLFSLIFSN